VEGSCEHGNEPSGSIKCWGNIMVTPEPSKDINISYFNFAHVMLCCFVFVLRCFMLCGVVCAVLCTENIILNFPFLKPA
jgi:hypothetical protein